MLNDAFEFYYKASELKDLLRSGAIQWRVNKERMESIAEHTYGCMILAIALQSELDIDVDLARVLEMITVHELEELSIGDITPLDKIDKDSLKAKARESVYNLVKNLKSGERLIGLVDEFEDCNTKEAKFAKAIDKLECVLEFKKYQDLGQVSLSNVTEEMLENKYLKAYVDDGKYDLADIFFLFHMKAYKDFGIDEQYWFSKLKPMNVRSNNTKR